MEENRKQKKREDRREKRNVGRETTEGSRVKRRGREERGERREERGERREERGARSEERGARRRRGERREEREQGEEERNREQATESARERMQERTTRQTKVNHDEKQSATTCPKEKLQGKYDRLVEFASTPGGQLAHTKDLFALPVVVTANYDTKNRDLLTTSDWLGRDANRVLLTWPRPSVEEPGLTYL